MIYAAWICPYGIMIGTFSQAQIVDLLSAQSF